MHMADALISPVVGGVALVVTIGIAAHSTKKIKNDLDEKKIPLMGVMGAFVFAAQMINFTIPATGSSGHLGGGMLLAILLGPYAGFLTMASVLLIQALVFGDGGLLAYGCNVFNLGFFTCFVAYPYIYKWFTSKGLTSKRIFVASMSSALLGLQMGAFSVVLETFFSRKTELPFGSFVLLMQPIHLAIGVVEGLVTTAIVTFIWRARPEIIEKAAIGEAIGNVSIKKVLTGLLISVVLIGGGFSWFASSNPDGLEWSMFKAAGKTELESTGKIHKTLSDIQSKTAILPDYNFKTKDNEKRAEATVVENNATKAESSLLATNAGTSASGIIGGALTLVLATFTGLIISFVKRKKKRLS